MYSIFCCAKWFWDSASLNYGARKDEDGNELGHLGYTVIVGDILHLIIIKPIILGFDNVSYEQSPLYGLYAL
jgi:hypothetical protein